MRSYIRMKYEQLLMRLFDKFLKYLSTTRLDWYPNHVLCYDLEAKIHELEMQMDRAEVLLIEKDEQIADLTDKLYFYEPWEEEPDE